MLVCVCMYGCVHMIWAMITNLCKLTTATTTTTISKLYSIQKCTHTYTQALTYNNCKRERETETERDRETDKQTYINAYIMLFVNIEREVEKQRVNVDYSVYPTPIHLMCHQQHVLYKWIFTQTESSITVTWNFRLSPPVGNSCFLCEAYETQFYSQILVAGWQNLKKISKQVNKITTTNTTSINVNTVHKQQ